MKNCIFCSSTLEKTNPYSASTYKTCKQCLVEVDYTIDNDSISYLVFKISESFNSRYEIELNYMSNTCILYKYTPTFSSSSSGYTFLTELNYLPNINPNNAKQWLTRLLNLMVFS